VTNKDRIVVLAERLYRTSVRCTRPQARIPKQLVWSNEEKSAWVEIAKQADVALRKPKRSEVRTVTTWHLGEYSVREDCPGSPCPFRVYVLFGHARFDRWFDSLKIAKKWVEGRLRPSEVKAGWMREEDHDAG
jgi:hypothetical protein